MTYGSQKGAAKSGARCDPTFPCFPDTFHGFLPLYAYSVPLSLSSPPPGATLPALKQQLRAHRIDGYAPKEGDDPEHSMDPAAYACPPDDDLCVPFPSALGAHLALPPAARPTASTASTASGLPAGPALSAGGASSMGATGGAGNTGVCVEVSSDVAALQARLRNLGLTTSTWSYTPPGSNGSTQHTASAGPGPGMGQGQGPVAVGTTAASPPASANRTASGGGGRPASPYAVYGTSLPFAYTSPSNPPGGLQAQVASWRSPNPSARSPLSPTIHTLPYAADAMASRPADHLAALRAATSASPIHHHQHNPYRSASSAGGSSTGGAGAYSYPGLQLPPPLVSSTSAQLSSPPGGSGAFGGAGAGAATASPGGMRSGLSTFGSGGGSALGAGGGAAQTVGGGDLNSWLASVGVVGANAAPALPLGTTGSGSLAATTAPRLSPGAPRGPLTGTSPIGVLTLTPVPMPGSAATTVVPTAGSGGAAAGVTPALGSTEPSPPTGFLNLTPFPGLGGVGPGADAGAGTAGEATPTAFGAVGGFAANGFGVPAAAAPAAAGMGGFGGFAAQQQPGLARGFGAAGPLATPPPLPTPALTPTLQQGRVDLSSLLLDDTPLPFGGAAGAGRSDAGAEAGEREGGFGGFGAALDGGAEDMDMTPVGFGFGGGPAGGGFGQEGSDAGAAGPGGGLSFGDVEGAGDVGNGEVDADFALLAAESEMVSWRLVGGSEGGAVGGEGQGEVALEGVPGRRSWGSGGGAPPVAPGQGEEAAWQATDHVRAAAARSPGAHGRKSQHSSPRRPGYVDMGSAAVALAAAAAGQDDVRAGVRDTSRPAYSAFASPHSRSSPGGWPKGEGAGSPGAWQQPQQQGLKGRGPGGAPLAPPHGTGSPGGMGMGVNEQGWVEGYGDEGDAMLISPMPAPGRGYALAGQQQQPSPPQQQQGASDRDRGSFGGGGAVGLGAAAGAKHGQPAGSTFTSLEAPQLSLEQLKARMQRVCMG